MPRTRDEVLSPCSVSHTSKVCVLAPRHALVISITLEKGIPNSSHGPVHVVPLFTRFTRFARPLTSTHFYSLPGLLLATPSIARAFPCLLRFATRPASHPPHPASLIPQYTMWFFDHVNPNDAMAAKLGKPKADKCHLDYYHKDGAPTPESDDMRECHPWKDNACCHKKTVTSVTQIKEAYGEKYHWDRCGTLSEACERFFVMEACFYECDPNAGLYRKFPDGVYNASDDSHNKWQMHKMPIKRSFCNAWHRACFNDNFCDSKTKSGSFFACAKEYEAADDAAKLATEIKKNAELAEKNAALAAKKNEVVTIKKNVDVPTLSTGGLVAIVISLVVGLGALSVVALLVLKEKRGTPMFSDEAMLHPTSNDEQNL